MFGWCELYYQPYKRRVHLHHFKQHNCTAQALWKQGSRSQKDLQQCEQDWQDVQNSVPSAVWDLQPCVLGHISEQGTSDQRSSVNSDISHPLENTSGFHNRGENQCQALTPCNFFRSSNNTACLLLQENAAMFALRSMCDKHFSFPFKTPATN